MNKASSAFLICFLAISVASEPLRSRQVRTLVPIELCKDGTDGYLPKAEVDVEPYPPHVQTGAHIEIAADIELAKAIEAGSTLELKMKKIGILEIPIPCLDLGLPINIGSCSYDGSEFLQIVGICPEHCPEGQASDLPLNPGKYGGSPLILDVGEIPAILAPFLKGKIEVFGRVFNGAGEEQICITTTIELV